MWERLLMEEGMVVMTSQLLKPRGKGFIPTQEQRKRPGPCRGKAAGTRPLLLAGMLEATLHPLPRENID